MEKTIAELRKACKNHGLTLRVKTYSEFKSAKIHSPCGYTVSNVSPMHMGPLPRVYEEYAEAIEAILAEFKGNTTDNGYRVIL